MSDQPQFAYKVLTAQQMAELEATGVFKGAPVDLADGYIHLSTATQLVGTIDKHFARQADLHIACVDLARLDSAVRWEESRGQQLFPHVYADLPLSAVTAHAPLERRNDGEIVLPSGGTAAV